MCYSLKNLIKKKTKKQANKNRIEGAMKWSTPEMKIENVGIKDRGRGGSTVCPTALPPFPVFTFHTNYPPQTPDSM